MTVRSRFAPSPTGPVHIGNIRVAIYNWLFARHEAGAFLLRVEDTDRDRSTPEACRNLLDAMEWLGLSWDEEPLYQSSRLDAHLQAAEELRSKGRAYKEDKGGTGRGEAIVFRMPGQDVSYHDEIKGDLVKRAEDMKDFVIVRSNGSPVFHLANVVDDIHMGITHVIRGDDHVENTYRHVALYRALGADVPRFAHLPMIVNAQGKPYSKRDGAAYVGEFREQGYLPEALLNYLALLGWSPGDDREVMSRKELIERFTLARVQSSPARMDPEKLAWLNGEHMRKLPFEVYREGIKHALMAQGLVGNESDNGYLNAVVRVMGDRIKRWSDAPRQCVYFFTEDYPFDERAVRKRLRKEGALEHLAELNERFRALEPFTTQTTEAVLRQMAEQKGVGTGSLIHPVRVAVSGTATGPGLFELLEVLGKERVLRRMERAVQRFGAGP